MAKQFELLTAAKRKPRRVLMHVIDAGYGDRNLICKFECGRCGHVSGWFMVASLTEAHRGLPCPKCNHGAVAVEDPAT